MTLDDVRKLVTELLSEINPAARLVELTESPDGRQYLVQIQVPPEIGKMLALHKPALYRAATGSKVTRSLRDVLRTQLLMQQTLSSVGAARELLASTCPSCLRPVQSQEHVVFRRGELFHVECCP